MNCTCCQHYFHQGGYIARLPIYIELAERTVYRTGGHERRGLCERCYRAILAGYAKRKNRPTIENGHSHK